MVNGPKGESGVGILSSLFGQLIETIRPALVLTELPLTELSFSFHGLAEARDALYNLMDMYQEVLGTATLCEWALEYASIGRDALHIHQQRILSNLGQPVWSIGNARLFLGSCRRAVRRSRVYAAQDVLSEHLPLDLHVS
jgi:hypothetical protein